MVTMVAFNSNGAAQDRGLCCAGNSQCVEVRDVVFVSFRLPCCASTKTVMLLLLLLFCLAARTGGATPSKRKVRHRGMVHVGLHMQCQ